MSDTNVLAAVREMKENDLFHDSSKKTSAFLPNQELNVSNFATVPVFRIPDGSIQFGQTLSFHLQNVNADYARTIYLELTLPQIPLMENVRLGYLDGMAGHILTLSQIQNDSELQKIITDYQNDLIERNVTANRLPSVGGTILLGGASLLARLNGTATAAQITTMDNNLATAGLTYDRTVTLLEAFIKNKYREPGDIYRVRWIDNVGHHIIKNATLSIGDMEYFTIDDFFMETQRHFYGDEKQLYERMIGNVPEMTAPTNQHRHYLPSYPLIIPLVFPICRGKSIFPISIVNGDIKIDIQLRDLEELVCVDVMSDLYGLYTHPAPQINRSIIRYEDDTLRMNMYPNLTGLRKQVLVYDKIPAQTSTYTTVSPNAITGLDRVLDTINANHPGTITSTSSATELRNHSYLNVTSSQRYFGRTIRVMNWGTWFAERPTLKKAQLNINFAKVQEHEKKWMIQTKYTRKIRYLSTDWNTLPRVRIDRKRVRIPMRTKHLIKAIYFAVRNATTGIEHGNYTTHARKPIATASSDIATTSFGNESPIEHVSLYYWKDKRFFEVPGIYFSHTQPHMLGLNTSDRNGLHMYSFNDQPQDNSLIGYANYEELENVDLEITLTDRAMELMRASANVEKYNGIHEPQVYELAVGYENYCLLNYYKGALDVNK